MREKGTKVLKDRTMIKVKKFKFFQLNFNTPPPPKFFQLNFNAPPPPTPGVIFFIYLQELLILEKHYL